MVIEERQRNQLAYLVPPLSHQKGMVARPEFVYPEEHRDEVPRYHVGRCPIRPRGPRWVGEGETGLLDQQTGD